LSFTTVAGAASYDIYRSTVSGGPYAKVGSAAAGTFTDPASALVAGKYYYYYVVTAVETGGSQSAYSNERFATPIVVPYRSALSWGTEGTGPGQFHLLDKLSVDSAGNVWVADTFDNPDLVCRVQEFTASGAYITKYAVGDFGSCADVAVSRSGNVYVANRASYETFGFTPNPFHVFAEMPVPVPEAVALDSAGNVYVGSDDTPSAGLPGIWKFTSDGAQISYWPTPDGVTGVAVDSSGDVYAAARQRSAQVQRSGTVARHMGGEAGDGRRRGFLKQGVRNHRRY
jgi:hypothetical protein